MEAFEFNYISDFKMGLATVICSDKSEIVGIMEKRGYENVKISNVWKTSLDKVKVSNLSVEDLIKVLEFVIVKDRRLR